MPGIRELYTDIYHAVMGAIAHPLRGIIVEPITGTPAYDPWQTGDRKVTISVTPSGASYPRRYDNVPYSGVGTGQNFDTPPNPGDYVDVVFKGGSTEFPTIVGHHAGTKSSQESAAAFSSRSAPAAQAVSLGIFSSTLPSLFPGLDYFSGIPSLTADPSTLLTLTAAPEYPPLYDGPLGLGTRSGSNFSLESPFPSIGGF